MNQYWVDVVMNRKKYLIKNTALFALNSVGIRIITFLLVPLYTSVFSTYEYGMIDLITTIATILIPLITVNIGEAVMRFSLDEDANRNEIICVGIFFICFSVIAGTLVFAALQFVPSVHINPVLIYVYCVIQGIYQILSCNLRGQEKLLDYAIANIINTFLVAILNIVLLIVLKWGINGYFISYICAYFLAGMYCIFRGNIFLIFGQFKINPKLFMDMVKYSLVLVPNSFMWWIMNSSDHIMVTAMVGVAANGIYAISYKIPSILSTLSTVFNQAWSYSAIREDKSEDREEFNNHMYDNLVSFQFLITAILLFITRPFLRLYVDKAYYEAWKYTPFLLIGYFFLTMGTFLSTLYTVNKDSKGFLISGSIGALLNIMLNFMLIPILEVYGTALATCISYISVFVYRYFDTQKYMHIKIFKKKYLFGYLMLIMIGITVLFNNSISYIMLSFEVIIIFLVNNKFLITCKKELFRIIKRI